MRGWRDEQAVQDNFAVLQAFFAEHFPSCKMVAPRHVSGVDRLPRLGIE